MKKKIEDLTLKEVADICKKCDSKDAPYGCPFAGVLIIDCETTFDDQARRNKFNEEIEVEDIG